MAREIATNILTRAPRDAILQPSDVRAGRGGSGKLPGGRGGGGMEEAPARVWAACISHLLQFRANWTNGGPRWTGPL
jgi:hypothetical protein